MDKVYKYIIQKTVTDQIDKKDAVQLLELLKTEKDKARRMDIAVVGVAAKTSNSENTDELWKNLCGGFDGISSIPEERKNDLDDYFDFKGEERGVVKYKDLAYLKNIDKFDYEYFGLSPREAELMDPHQRLFLETACTAIEEAGYNREKLKKTKTGIYLGYISGNFGYQNLVYDAQVELGTRTILGNMASLIPSRVSYMLDLRGPSVLVDTTCSSSLVAIHLACQALRLKECEQALVGGVKINILPLLDGLKLGIESSTGKTLTFDEASDGTGQGEGVGVVMLKPLQKAILDGDNIRAVIKGSAINQDGQSLNMSAPNPQAQTEVINSAWELADIKPETISFIEAHGTGTSLGDPIEIEGLTKAFKNYTNRKQFCAVSSIKSNIGHLDEAAGIFGFIKTVLSLENKVLPPSINFNEPNHKINWEESPVYVNDKLKKWKNRKRTARRAGVSSFGLSGTNAHIVLEEADFPKIKNSEKTGLGENILKISARNEESLKKLIQDYFVYFSDNKKINLVDACYTANVGRSDYEYRLVIIFSNYKDLLNKLREITEKKDLSEINNESCFYSLKKDNDFIKNSDSEIILRNNVLNKILETYKKKKRIKRTELKTLFQLYVGGAELDWGVFYNEIPAKKIKLPTYPFLKKRCWLKFPKVNEKDIHFELVWRPEPLAPDPIIRNEVLVFQGKGEIAKQLLVGLEKEVGKENIVKVSFGKKFEKLNQKEFIIRNQIEDYERLFNYLQEKDLYQIVHLASLDSKNKVKKLEDLLQAEKRGSESLFCIAKVLQKKYWNKVLDLVLVSDLVTEVSGNEQNIKPENAPLFGLAKGLFVELPNWHCRAIDIDNDKSIAGVLSEIRNEYTNHKVAYRQGVRFIEEFRKSEQIKKEIKIREQGVYLFAGGTGGVTLELMKFLSKQEKVNLLVLSRSKAPSRDKWLSIIKKADTSIKEKKRLQNFLEIEKNGTKIFFYQVDITREKDLANVIAKIKKDFGEINGIVQAAGQVSLNSFAEKIFLSLVR